ncbi:MAG TPA: hypothetical protein VLS89_00545 [Candidatus Nanopelagicales bacterium]|nr:hypothetical protein [Candidatus Nanopelagicales bacterium]
MLHEALRELGSLPKDAWERRVVMPHLTAWRVAMAQDLQGLTDEEKDVMKNLDEIYREWETRTKEEGRREGRREGKRKGRREGQRAGRREGQRLTLMKLLTARFGVLSDAAVARIKAADAAQLDAWTDRVLTAASLPELLGDA